MTITERALCLSTSTISLLSLNSPFHMESTYLPRWVDSLCQLLFPELLVTAGVDPDHKVSLGALSLPAPLEGAARTCADMTLDSKPWESRSQTCFACHFISFHTVTWSE